MIIDTVAMGVRVSLHSHLFSSAVGECGRLTRPVILT